MFSKIYKPLLLVFMAFLISLSPVDTLLAESTAFDVSGRSLPDLITCGYDLDEGGEECGLGDLFLLLNNLITFLLQLVLILGVFLLMWTGLEYALSTNANKKTTLKKRLLTVVKGLAFIVGAWLIVNTLLWAFGVRDGYNILDDDFESYQDEEISTEF